MYNKGFAINGLGIYQEAIEWLDKALRIDPNYEYAWNSKGFALYNLGKYQEAIECFDKALRIDPNNKEALNNKGLALNGLGIYQEAIECFDKALAVDPNFTLAQNNKKLILETLTKEKSSSYSNTTSRGTMPKGWKLPSSSFDKITVVDNLKTSVLTKSDDVIIQQKENLSQPPKEERSVAKGSELSASRDTINSYSFINSWGSKRVMEMENLISLLVYLLILQQVMCM